MAIAEPRGEPLVGRTLGAYRILAALGSGGMGQVYLAEDTRLDRRVALKVLPPEMAAHPEKIARFEREARAVASLSHPGIVMLHSIEEAEALRFLTMEHVVGETLSRQIPPRGFATERLLSLAIALTDAVGAAHRQGILHRDLKPDNVMITAEGRLKVLDFGLAKLRAEGEPGDRTTRETESVTQDGRIVGTVAYMSPEQAQGLEVDTRSDIFSLGVLLYEMATGERPFRGATNLAVLSSVLKDSPRPVSELRDDVPRPFARMVQRALEKRPEDRYQSAIDLRRDLEDLKRDVDSGELRLQTTAGRPRFRLPEAARRSWARLGAAGAGAVLLALLLAYLARPAPPAAPQRRSLAVFYFDNLSGDPQLDWLRTGLTDMLVTNLSQSSELRVLGTTRLYQLLAEAGHRDERAITAPLVAAVSREARATTALVGSFVRAGPQLRIQASLQDPDTGEVWASERVEGDAQSGLFTLVDELTGRLRRRLEPRTTARGGRRGPRLEDVTTSSVAALRAYAEGSRLHDRMQEREAQGFFEKAVEADPGFATALAKLSIVHGNLGELDRARSYSARAVEKARHLPPEERHYIEGRHYSLDPATLEKAVSAYQQAVDAAPDHTAARNNLAQLLFDLRRYPEALVHLEELRRRGMTFPGSYMSLAQAYLAVGRPDAARETLSAYAAEHPDRPAAHENLGYFELMQGRIEAALDAFDKAAALKPKDRTHVALGRFVAHGLRDDWPAAEEAARRLYTSSDPRERWQGGASLATLALLRGDLSGARRLAEEGVRVGRPGERLEARLFRARLEYDVGAYPSALGDAEAALAEAPGDPRRTAEVKAVKALCLTRLGRREPAARAGAEVEAYLASLPPALGGPLLEHFEGERALARGDWKRARGLLAKAAESLPAAALKMEPRAVRTLYALAWAAREEGAFDEARAALSRITGPGPERFTSPVLYVRSLALLADLEEKAGRGEEARRLLARYLRYWKDGDIDREEVARASGRLAALAARPTG